MGKHCLKWLAAAGVVFALLPSAMLPARAAAAVKHGNVVLFARFLDDASDQLNGDYIYNAGYTNWQMMKSRFNEYSDDAYLQNQNSLARYMRIASGGAFEVINVFPQESSDGKSIGLITLPRTKSGYTSNFEQILRDAVDAAGRTYPNADLAAGDQDGDGWLDNITVIVQTTDSTRASDTDSTDPVWPRKFPNSDTTLKFAGKYMDNVNILDLSRADAGTLAHEYLHSQGLPDLYRYSGEGDPVGIWDIMAKAVYNYPLAYQRQVLGWIRIPETAASGDVTLSAPGSGSGNQAVIINSPLMSNEFFVAEYRKKAENKVTDLDGHLPFGSNDTGGLILYRVNNNLEDKTNAAGRDYIYVFRPDDTGIRAAAGNLEQAYLSLNGRTEFGSSDLSKTITGNALCFSDGQNSGIRITVTAQTSDSISFHISVPDYSALDLWKDSGAASALPSSITAMSSTAAPDGSIYLYSQSETGSGSAISRVDRYSGGVWQQVGTDFASLEGGQIAVAQDGTPYVIGSVYSGSDSSLQVYAYRGSWTRTVSISTGSTPSNMPRIYNAGGTVYAVYDRSSNSEQVILLNESGYEKIGAPVSGDYLSDPALAVWQGSLYLMTTDTFAKSPANVPVLYRLENGAWTVVKEYAGSVSNANRHQLLAADGKLYALATNNGVYDLQCCDGSSWSPVRMQLPDSGSIQNLKIAVSGGVVYAAVNAAVNTGESGGTLKVYALNGGTLTPLGSSVFNNVEDFNLLPLNGTLYAAALSGGQGVVRSHEMVHLGLSGLALSAGTLRPAFRPDQIFYATEVENSVTQITLTPQAADSTGTIRISGTALTGGSAYTADLAEGDNTFLVQVTSADGKAETNYVLTVTRNVRKSLSSASVVLANTSYVYTGGAVEPLPEVVCGGNTLTKDTDYQIRYQQNISAGHASMLITGIGRYQGTISAGFTITPEDASAFVLGRPADRIYTGSPAEPDLSITRPDGTVLTRGTDYVLSYGSGNVNSGDVPVTVTYTGNYTGTAASAFRILPAAVDAVSLSYVPAAAYTGAALEPAVTVSYRGHDLTAGRDYTVSYQNNTEPGTGIITVAGAGTNFTGSREETFAIAAADPAFSIDALADSTYTGSAVTPALVLRDQSGALLENSADFRTEWFRNTDAGTAGVLVSGRDGTAYAGQSASAVFRILPRSIADGVLSAVADQKYTGAEVHPVPELSVDSRTLTAGADYSVTCQNNLEAGENARLTCTGQGNYTGSISASFAIRMFLADYEILPVSVQTYTGSALQPEVTVVSRTDAGRVLKAGTDYTAVYADNVNAGTARVTVTGTGSYAGSLEASFVIQPVQMITGVRAPVVEAPVTGAARQSVLVSGTGYDGEITWSPAGELFAKNTAYTAHIVLRARPGFLFAADSTAFVPGAAITGLNVAADRTSMSFDAVFAATADRRLSRIRLDPAGSDVQYREGDIPSGVRVIAVFDDQSQLDVTASAIFTAVHKGDTAFAVSYQADGVLETASCPLKNKVLGKLADSRLFAFTAPQNLVDTGGDLTAEILAGVRYDGSAGSPSYLFRRNGKGSYLSSVKASGTFVLYVSTAGSGTYEAADRLEIGRVTVLPAASSVRIRKDGADAGAFLNVMVTDTAALRAEVLPQDALQKVVWSSSDTAVAAVDPVSGALSLHQAGRTTVTAAAADGSHRSGSVLLKVYSVDPAAAVSASLDSSYSSAGMEAGSTTRVRLFADGIGDITDQAEFRSSNDKAATVDADGIITFTGAGTASITAALKGDPDGRTAVVSVRGTAALARTIRIRTAADTPYEADDAENVTLITADWDRLAASGTRSVSLQAVLFNRDGREFQGPVRWSSGDASTAAVSAKGVVTVKKAGETVITAVSQDAAHSRASVKFVIRDYAPVLETKTYTLNSVSAGGVPFAVHEAYQNKVTGVAVYETVNRQRQISTRFRVSGESNSWTLEYCDDQNRPSGKSYPVTFVFTTAGGRGEYSCAGTVRTIHSLPAVRVKYSGTVNSFFRDNALRLILSDTGYAVERLTLEGSAEFLHNFQIADGKTDGTLTVARDLQTVRGRPALSGVLKIRYQGFTEDKAVNITIPSAAAKPSWKLDRTSVSVYGNSRKISLQLLDGSTGKPVTLTGIQAAYDTGTTAGAFSGSPDLVDGTHLVLTGTGSPGTARLKLASPEWTGSLSFAISVHSVSALKVNLQGTAVLNQRTAGEQAVLTPVISGITGMKITALNPDWHLNTRLGQSDADIVLTAAEDGTVRVSLNSSARAGTYRGTITPELADADGNAVKVTAGTEIQVVVTDREPQVTAAVSGSINPVDRNSAALLKISVSGLTDTVSSIALTGENAGRFRIQTDPLTGKYQIAQAAGTQLPPGSYPVGVRVMLRQTGRTYDASRNVIVRAVQALPVLKISGNAMIMYNRWGGDALIGMAEIAFRRGQGIITAVEPLYDPAVSAFEYSLETHAEGTAAIRILRRDASLARTGSTATLKFRIHYQGETAAAYSTVTITIRDQSSAVRAK